MFCHQCQETMGNSGCTLARGVCGKTGEVSDLQDLLLYACQGIGFWASRAEERGLYDEGTAFFVDKCLFATITNANFSADYFIANILAAVARRDKLRASLADKLVAAVKSGAIRRFVVMAGCAKYRYN
jgi:hydroxylamine reductase